MHGMKQSHAAGRKTENSLGLLGEHLDRQLARLTEALGTCLDQADAVPREDDEYGHRRAGEIAHAVAFAKASAKLIASLAKVNHQFQHNITVSHRAEEEIAPPIESAPYPSREELQTMTNEELAAGIAARKARGTPPKIRRFE
jgi:hypothetical protein